MREQGPRVMREKPNRIRLEVERLSREIEGIHHTIAKLVSTATMKDRKIAMQIKEFTPRKTYRIAYMSELKFDAFSDAHAESIWQNVNLNAIESEVEDFNKVGIELENKVLRLHYFNRVETNCEAVATGLSALCDKKGGSQCNQT
jgi:hypothetical protein